MKKLFLFNALFVFCLVGYGQKTGSNRIYYNPLTINSQGIVEWGGKPDTIPKSTKGNVLKSVWTDAVSLGTADQHFFDNYRKDTPTNEPSIGGTLKWTNAANAKRAIEFVITPVKVIMLFCDTVRLDYSVFISNPAYWQYGYEVLEKHNTDEGQIDPYNQFGYVSQDYFIHKSYLNGNKKPFSSSIIIWQSKQLNK